MKKETKALMWKILSYVYIVLGIICMIAQIAESGIYTYGEDATLMIIGLLLLNIGVVINK